MNSTYKDTISLSKGIRTLLNLILFIYPISIICLSTSHTILLSYIINLLLITITLFIYLVRDNTVLSLKLNPIVLLLFIFAAYASCSILWSIDRALSFDKSITLILLSINSLFLYNLLSLRSINQLNILYGIIGAAWINFVLFLLTDIVIGRSVLFFDDRFIGTKTNANEIGFAFTFAILSSLVLLTKGQNKTLTFLTIAACLYLIVLTGSKKNIIGAILLVGIYPFLSGLSLRFLVRFIVLSLLLTLVIVYWNQILVFFDNDFLTHLFKRFNRSIEALTDPRITGSTSERIHLINLALSKFAEKPLFGHGINTFLAYSPIYSHSNILELGSGLGVIGVVLFYLLPLYCFILIHRHVKDIKERRLIYTFLVVLILLDLTAVTYYSKLHVLLFVFLSSLSDISGIKIQTTVTNQNN